MNVDEHAADEAIGREGGRKEIGTDAKGDLELFD